MAIAIAELVIRGTMQPMLADIVLRNERPKALSTNA
jgi:hypothetical protein